MSPFALLTVYCLATIAASMAGGSLPLLVRLTHARMQLTISFVSGVMLGVGVLDMLPHAVLAMPKSNPHEAMIWVLGGFLGMFFVQRFLAVHHHVAPGDDEHAHEEAHRRSRDRKHAHQHDCDHQHHDRDPSHAGAAAHLHAHGLGGDAECERHDVLPAEGVLRAEKFTWTGAAMGLGVHTMIGGLALAAAVEAQARTAATAGENPADPAGGAIRLGGLATFVAIVLHKPLDALTISTLMKAGGWRPRDVQLVNGLFALSMPLGAALFYLGFMSAGGGADFLLGRVLAVSAGTFLCIAASDLLPEMQFHSHDRVKLTGALLAGVGLAWWMERVAHG